MLSAFFKCIYPITRWDLKNCAKLMMFEAIIIIEKGKGVNIIYVYARDSQRERTTGIFLKESD